MKEKSHHQRFFKAHKFGFTSKQKKSDFFFIGPYLFVDRSKTSIHSLDLDIVINDDDSRLLTRHSE